MRARLALIGSVHTVVLLLAVACIGLAIQAQSLPGFPPPLGRGSYSPPSMVVVHGEADEAIVVSIVSAIEAESDVVVRVLLDVDVELEDLFWRGHEPLLVVGGPNENLVTRWANSILPHPFTIGTGQVSFNWCDKLESNPGIGVVQCFSTAMAPALLVAGLSSAGTARAATALLSGRLGPLDDWKSPAALIREEVAEIMRPIVFSPRLSVYPSRWPSRFLFENGVLDAGLSHVELAEKPPRVVIVLSALVSGSFQAFPTGWIAGWRELPIVIPLSVGRLAVTRVDVSTGVVELSVKCDKLISSPDPDADSNTVDVEPAPDSLTSLTVVLEPGSMLGPLVYSDEWRDASAGSDFADVWIGTTEMRLENAGVGTELVLPIEERYTWDEGFVVLLFRSEDSVRCYVEQYPSLGQW